LNKKILIFIDWYKPGFKAGGPIRSISNLVNQLNDKANYYIVTRDTDYSEHLPYKNIISNQWNQVDESKVYYLSSSNIKYTKIKELINEINPDTIYCNSLFSVFFSILPIFIAKKKSIRHVLAVRGMLSGGSLSVKNRKKDIFITVMKFLSFYKSTIFHATNLSEKKDISRELKSPNIIIANNLSKKKEYNFIQKTKKDNCLKLVSIGRIAPEKNTLFALEVLKNVRSNIIFDIYGPIGNNQYWKDCKSIINQLPDNIVFNYKGVLEHQLIEETLLNYQALFLPSTGENYGHVIVEAMINSCIPIISDKTPWKGLEKQKIGFDVSLDDKNLFVEKIEFLNSIDNKSLIK
jgi:glycosyltransferase involved in cell wall biosynthesis